MTTGDKIMSDELPYGGTVKSFREDVARLAARGEAVFGETVLKAPPWTDEHKELNLLSHGCSLYGWATASLLRWIGERFGDEAAFEAAALVQDMAMNGGAKYADDLDVLRQRAA
jgi:hypothetical protein